ncbi:mucin-desulfating sulfatase (n-acetylglucosamine-6-sulfatase) [Colletotrichum scovillei]|uniref:mucin-desulfating sulfatase (n-acetylglucosamine-6-sulfatase) n=1 Tax=Colletotrichum scovillei TaxID=1209932 RepID=UPI0015C31C84|nr:mucin-desulfating sulfatase (n-acetylglucosamine-6-sulfatase) [Colletotrichum scovillei]KAF4785949.1 mucin-desulfating sulfatase (n-acetylglucosamine-6-sulfatase) [Colletotrichum scovillei]
MTNTRPNILFIMADDHASKAISAYGAGINHTPNIDRLAAEGMKFNHCYVTNSICTPSRAAILTGTHNHVNGVMTLNDNINKHLPNVAKHMRTGGYSTAMVGKWHLGEGRPHEPTGFDYWSVLPGQGDYWDPEFIEPAGEKVEDGYVTDIITDKCLDWISKTKNTDKPFFLMCHHKAPHRSWECNEKHKDLYKHPIRVPETYDDDYKNRAKAAKVAKMRVAEDMTYQDLGLVQPDGGNKVGERVVQEAGSAQRKIPIDAKRLIDKEDGTVFTFKSQDDLAHFKFQRYMQRYLRTIQSVDDNVGRMLDYLEENGLAENTIVIYTSDQGFFLGEHGWFDKRFMYEESFQMPFLIRYPAGIAKGSVCDDIICNVDFAPTFLDFANLHIPSYMQGESFRQLLQGNTPADWQQIAYHRYWMHNDIIHHAYAHYGVRDQRYKLIYWYNEPLEISGARPGGEKDKEWELFDCEKDPLELFNVYHDPAYADTVKHMTRLLELKMEQIGDEPVHPKGVDAGGLVDLATCPIETIYLQYPSDENDFSNDGDCGDGGSYRLYVRLEITRRDIMKLTRGVTLCDQPFLPLTKLIGDFESDLSEIGSLMPDGTNFSMVNIGALESDRWLRRRLFMHISFHQAHCDLYRILLSGYPEAAPRVVLEAVDVDYITTAEQNCLEHATAIIQILTSLNQHSTELLLLEFDTAICAYHATRLLLFIARAQRTPGCPSPEFALSRAALCLAALQRFFPSSALVKPIIDDMERLSRGDAPQEAGIGGLSSPEFQEGRRNLEQRLSEVAKARQRLAIHSLLRQADFTDEDEGDDYSSSMSASGLSPIMMRRTP